MSKDTKINLKADHEQHSDKQAGKRGLLLRFIIFMAWVAAISLLLSLMSCQPNEPIIFVIGISSL
ncbi:hypothetical protein ACS8E3_01990 [Psychrobacter sp. 2Y5]|uniref:hypothetical protein n=1 Tax=unclassified Psychrobacter TaxID=196806 RepID=UPI003F48B957